MNAMHPLTSVSTSGHLGTMATPKKVVIALNTAWNMVNFRSGLIRALIENGHDVIAVAPTDEYVPKLISLGCRYVPMPMDNQGTHPVRDLILLWRFFRLMRSEDPDVFLGYTVKPNVYGSLAARLLGIPVINNIAGLGAVFIREGWLVRVVRWLYRSALRRSAKVFFQNDDDRQLFISGGLVRAEVTDLLPGSGIDLNRFTPWLKNIGRDDGSKFRFLLIARMLRDKGVVEYVEAARLLRQRWPLAEFCLLGFLDVQNPTAISHIEMDAWVAEGVVNYLGVSEDVRTHLVKADCVVLPSYREGTPRTLLEAAAMARPIITTDAVGCREVVDDGVNGYLCKVRDAGDLSAKMELMLSLSPEQRSEMGQQGRAKMVAMFDEQIVIGKYLAAIEEILAA
jgi:glycosyltransferase involved in cell wall biosynthesis